MTKQRIIVNGEILNKGDLPLDFIPRIDDLIIYKTFRSNTSMTDPWYDYQLKVVLIIWETEEFFNETHKNKVVNIYTTLVEKKLIKQ